MTSQPGSSRDSEGERLWRAYLTGYEYGTAYGTTAGYREALTDMFDVHAHLVTSGLLRRPSYAEVTRRRQAAFDGPAPALSAAEIRARAAASWDLTPDEPPAAPRDSSSAVPCTTARGARRRIHHT